MTEGAVIALARAALDRFAARQIQLPVFVLELERAVDAAEEIGDPHAGRLRKAWGELEILNALTDGPLDEGQGAEVAVLVADFERLLT